MSSTNGHADAVHISEVDNLGAIIERFSARIDALEREVARLNARLDAMSADPTDLVIEEAQRQARDGVATFDYKLVMAAAGVTAPTAYSYMDQLEADHEWVRQYTGASGNRRIQFDFNERPSSSVL